MDLMYPKGWPELFMQHSGDALGLCIAMDTDRTPGDELTLQKLVCYLERVEWLMIYGRQTYEFLRMATRPAPRLRRLALGSQPTGPRSPRNQVTQDFVVPSDLFAGHVPSLYALLLNGLPIDPSSPLLSTNLTLLALIRGQPKYHTRGRFLSLLDLIEVLRRMPRLEMLLMNDVLTLPQQMGR
ncbi:hypothetical protein EWM64_g7492 [Hericium alpestre]|uniref:Uncharacterized protein n=1 Tax=Hericium alpestre TaxID=135208 RepID=A0A4Y9ZQL9_9AGAM|nr:hypothetical protein EWM64_g7492 [Hericium alpestre]